MSENFTPPTTDQVQQVLSLDVKHARWYYVASAVISIVFLAIIIVIWIRENNAPFRPRPDETIMQSQTDVDNYLSRHLIANPGADKNIYIPTGIVIQTMEFKGPYTVQVGGYLWQRYANDLPPLDRGVVFPEADTTTFTKVYETQQGNETLIGWNFKTTIREQFDYFRYPLDRQLMWMRIWSVEFAKNVYLVPDVKGYTTLDPYQAPGLDRGLVLEGWDINSSYFSFRLNKYNSNFGVNGYDPQVPQPELYFNIPLKRLILSPLVARGVAPLVILIQLFVIVMVIGSDSKRLEAFGVRPGAIIFTCAAFFFAMLIAQNALRDELKWYGIVYLETVYVLTYYVIFAVAANSVALVAFPKLGLFRSDNLPIEVLYWPTILGILLIITLVEFA